jgi:hypothetical protein
MPRGFPLPDRPKIGEKWRKVVKLGFGNFFGQLYSIPPLAGQDLATSLRR